MNDTIYETWNNMIAMFEGEGKYFWAIPMCMSFSSKTDEASAIEHLEEFYRLIKNTKGGCGIMLYTGLTYSWEVEPIGNIGYYDLQVSAEEFKTWKNRKKPWSSYYERFYDKNGNAINGGFEPWSDLKSKIEEVSSSVNAHNKANVKKIETDISIEQNAVFEYNGLPQYPEVYPDYLNYEYGFMDKSTEIMSSVPPVKVGEYEIIVTLPESHFRKGTTVRADYRIKESDKTLILPSEITENYYGSSFTVSVRKNDLTYSFDNIDYQPYIKDTPIDVTDYVVRSDYSNNIYFKDGDKKPYVLPIRTYRETLVFDFEGATSNSGSKYRLAANRQFTGKQSAYCQSEYGTDWNGGEIYDFYFSDSQLPEAVSGPDLHSAKYFEIWIYAEEDIQSIMLTFAVSGWKMTVCNDILSVSAGQWTKLSFDLQNMSDPNIELKGLIEFTLTTNNSANFYVDNIVAVSL